MIRKNKKQLLKRIQELEEAFYNMKKAKQVTELLDFPWVGNLGQWYWMVESNQVEFNDKKVTNLGYDLKELPEKIGFDFFTNKLHPEDYDAVMENMRNHLMNITDAYEVEYRIRAKNGEYRWYYDRGKVTKRDEKGKALVVSGIVFDISRNKAMESELRAANEKLTKLVNIDELTGAFNRRYLLEKVDYEIKRNNRIESSFSLIMIDVDRFKLVNDNFGHSEGDLVLKGLVELIKKRIRNTDILCRWGGEEFIILLPDTTLKNAAILAEDIRSELREMVIGKVGSITASFGVSSYDKGESADSVIKKADDLMYKAKSEGRDCVRY